MFTTNTLKIKLNKTLARLYIIKENCLSRQTNFTPVDFFRGQVQDYIYFIK